MDSPCSRAGGALQPHSSSLGIIRRSSSLDMIKDISSSLDTMISSSLDMIRGLSITLGRLVNDVEMLDQK